MNMHGVPLPLSPSFKPLHYQSSQTSLFYQNQPTFSIPICRFGYGGRPNSNFLSCAALPFSPIYRNLDGRRRGGGENYHKTLVKASTRGSPYQVLGVSPSATPDEIKKVYRILALKYHPDVNKEPNAQEIFVRIKHAYNTVFNSDSRRKYDFGNHTSNHTRGLKIKKNYGFGNFFRFLLKVYNNRMSAVPSKAKAQELIGEISGYCSGSSDYEIMDCSYSVRWSTFRCFTSSNDIHDRDRTCRTCIEKHVMRPMIECEGCLAFS